MLDGVSFAYRSPVGERVILDDFSAQFTEGSWAIMGPSGVGKTTLFKIMSGDVKPQQGEVHLTGSIARVHQEFRLVEFLSVTENLQLAAEVAGPRGVTDTGELLEKVGLTGLGDAMVPTLSGGEQQRLAVARALATGAGVILADEPTGSLDERNTARVARLLAQLGDDGYCVVVCTHDRGVADMMGRQTRLTASGLVKLSRQDSALQNRTTTHGHGS